MEYPQPPQMTPPPQPGQEYPVVVAPYQQTYMIPPPQPGQGYPGGGLVAPHPQQIQAWSTGLCDCCDDCDNCCITCWCPCITFGQVAEIIDRGATSCGTAGAMYMLIMMLTGCHWIYSCMYRSRFRAENNLEEAPCCDCCVHFCCELCALCQLSRELKNRNWDLNLGYRMNLEKRRGAAAGVPPPMQGMIR